jgi:DNA primase
MTMFVCSRGADPRREELDSALAKIDVEHYLERAGIDFTPSYGTRGLQLNLHECPVCGEGGRKTYINAETGLGNCFHGACGFKFNRFKLIRAVSGLSGGELDAHIKATAEDQGWMPKRERVELVKADLELPSKLKPIPSPDGRNLAYLQNRGVTVETAQWFNLSFCKGGWWGYKLADGTQKWMNFDRRVIIPIADLDGRLVSFQGRDITGTQEPKYMFPVGYAVAGSHLYNGHTFEQGRHTHAVVGEGAFDAIGIYQAITGAASCEGMLPVATFGMHLSAGPDGQIAKFAELKTRGLRVVTIMWDGEGKALAEAVKAGLQLLALGLTVRIARIPMGYDPAQGPDNEPVPPELVRQWIFQATTLDRLTAIRLAAEASRMRAAEGA